MPVSRRLGTEERRLPRHHVFGDRVGLAWLTLGKIVHDIEHQAFHDRPQRPRSGTTCLAPQALQVPECQPRTGQGELVIQNAQGSNGLP